MWETMLDNMINRLKSFGIADVFDILLLGALFFVIYRFIRRRRALSILIGVAGFLFAREIVLVCGFSGAYGFLNMFCVPGILMIAIIFQQEIRSVLEKVGATIIGFFKLFFGKRSPAYGVRETDAIVKAVNRLSTTRTGALIVLERNTGVEDIGQNGVKLDAIVSTELICNLFFPRSPLHDGAIIISRTRICVAGCFLPNYSDRIVDSTFGSRHRAAIGMSRSSDAGVIVVSEETGTISYAFGGELKRGIGESELRSILSGYYKTVKKTTTVTEESSDE